MKKRIGFVLFLCACAVLLGLGCADRAWSSHSMSFMVSMRERYDQAVHEVISRNEDASQTLPAALARVNQENEAEYQEIIRLLDAWARREGFCRIPPDWFPRNHHIHLIPTYDNLHHDCVYYEEYCPADPDWPIQVSVIVMVESARITSVVINGVEGLARQPSERLKAAYASLRAALTGRFGKNGSILR